MCLAPGSQLTCALAPACGLHVPLGLIKQLAALDPAFTGLNRPAAASTDQRASVTTERTAH
eukprot:7285292-Prymnesium_polylepis.1